MVYQRQSSGAGKLIDSSYCSFPPHFVRWIVRENSSFIGYKHNISALDLAEHTWPNPYSLLHPFTSVSPYYSPVLESSHHFTPVSAQRCCMVISALRTGTTTPTRSCHLLPLSAAFFTGIRSCSLILTNSMPKMSNLNVSFQITESMP